MEQSKNINKKRKEGSFYTPKLFVNYAHKMIEETLGEDWKERYVVWDNCCGIGNLTKDYCFKELYASTLHQSDIDIVRQYNKDTTQKFQFDFLNDPIEYPNSLFGDYTDKLPKGLKDAFLNDKPIMFFINPPYATGCNIGTQSGGKAGTNDTMIRKIMHDEDLGSGAENIQHQFLYRICNLKETFNLTNIHICLFSNPIFLTGERQKDFLKYFCNHFSFNKGIMFQASEFANVSKSWGITFNIWNCGKNKDNNNFIHTLIESEGETIYEKGQKNLYNVWNDVLANKWVRKELKNTKYNIEIPCVCNALKIKEPKRELLTNNNSIGYFHNNANSIRYNDLYVGMYSTPFASAHGVVIIHENYEKCISLFSARKLIKGNWINSKDEYLAPDETNPKYNEFINDSIVYSLFHSSSNQSSLRQIEYKEKKWDIYNEFFWMSKAEIMQLANDNNFSECYNDARTSKDRYVYKKLQTITLSAEAQAVLDKANEIVRNTFKYRGMFGSEHPEYQIMNWDCGWYQIKALAKEYKKSEYDEFSILFKKLEEKMRPMVYELGFLK